MTYALLFSTFVIATCGLVYELVAGTLASYLLGDTITQFSTVIGTYLFSMGIGSYLSRFIGRGLVARFIQIELMVGLVGGLSAGILFLTFSFTSSFRLVLYLLVMVVGTLVGLEIPLLIRILKDQLAFHELVAQVLTFDYLGALAASLAFPMVLVPHLGLIRTALLFGLANALVALWSTFIFRTHLPAPGLVRVQCLGVLAMLVAGFAFSNDITELAESSLYSDEVILARTSPYQRIVLTRWRDDIRLFLNGHLQFSSRDEHRYHEALVHPALASVPAPRRALVLGGGDGLAVREILRYPAMEAVHLVDLDPAMTQLFKDHPLLTQLNAGSLRSPKVTVINQDAFVWLDRETGMYDLIVVDLPDPSNYSLGKLYTTAFYKLVKRHLAVQGVAVVQATSPMFARKSFWSVVETVKSAELTATPYHAYVPSFGEWGFVLATHHAYVPPTSLPPDLEFLDVKILPGLFEFPRDMAPVTAEVNRLNNQYLVSYYEEEWREVMR